jgi:hypothetical protein
VLVQGCEGDERFKPLINSRSVVLARQREEREQLHDLPASHRLYYSAQLPASNHRYCGKAVLAT